MKKIILTLAVIASSFSQLAQAGGITLPSDEQMSSMTVVLFPTYLTVAPTMLTGKISGQHKVVMEAQEDIAYFVATNGAVRTARFNQAMSVVREISGDQQSQDLELAEAILGGAK